MICETTKVKAKYRLGVIEDVKKSEDNVVRSATVRYSVTEGGSPQEVAKTVKVRRSVQRLALVMPVEEQESPLSVEENDVVVNVFDARKK